MARLRKLGKSGHYFALFYDAARRPKEKSYPLRTTRKDVAMKRFARAVDDYEHGRLDPWNPETGAEHLTLPEAREGFLTACAHLRPKTIEAYDLALRGLMKQTPPDLLLRALRPEQVRAYVLAGSASVATQQHRYRHLRAFFNWALRQGYLEKHLLEGVKLPKEQKKVAKFLTPAHVERLLSGIDADLEMKGGYIKPGEVVWLKDLILVAVCTGLRRAELCNLRWADIDFDTGFLFVRNHGDFVTKSGHERGIPLAGDALDVLRRRSAETSTTDTSSPAPPGSRSTRNMRRSGSSTTSAWRACRRRSGSTPSATPVPPGSCSAA